MRASGDWRLLARYPSTKSCKLNQSDRFRAASWCIVNTEYHAATSNNILHLVQQAHWTFGLFPAQSARRIVMSLLRSLQNMEFRFPVMPFLSLNHLTRYAQPRIGNNQNKHIAFKNKIWAEDTIVSYRQARAQTTKSSVPSRNGSNYILILRPVSAVSVANSLGIEPTKLFVSFHWKQAQDSNR